jgi:hypothetical protein
MTTKDWKLEKKTRFQDVYHHRGAFAHKIIINYDKANKSYEVYDSHRNNMFMYFKTKFKALKFAKQYMRNH